MARILIVDDDDRLVRLYQAVMEKNGHETQSAFDGVQALDFFNESHFDLVITDWNMPRMKGDELSKRIKEKSPAIPIIMITSDQEPENHKANMVMVKPISAEELICAVNLQLKK